MSKKKRQLRGVYIQYAGMSAPICTTLSEDDLAEDASGGGKCDAVLAWLRDGGEPPAGAEAWLRRNRAAVMEAVVDSDDMATLDKLLSSHRRLPPDELFALIERTGRAGSPDAAAYLLEYRRTRYTAAELDGFERRRVDAELGLRELTASEWKKRFKLAYAPDGVHIIGCKTAEEEILIPARIGGKPVSGVDAVMFFGREPMPRIAREWPDAPACPELSAAQAGDTIAFGRCMTAKKAAEQPVMWQVLSREEGRILVLSSGAIATAPYHRESREVTWASCDLRKWLNEAFCKLAFSKEEQRRIRTTAIPTADNPRFGSSGGEDTLDRVFLLSTDEAERYLASDEARALGRWWWLRTPGFDNAFAAAVSPKGAVVSIGSFVEGEDYLVRPAMWLDAT